MEKREAEGSQEEAINFGKEGEGFHVICGTGPKNNINGTIPGLRMDHTTATLRDIGCGEGGGGILDLSGLNSLLVADLDYFVEHHEEILESVKKQIEMRDY